MKKLFTILLIGCVSFTFAQRGGFTGNEVSKKNFNINKTPTDTLLPGNFLNVTGLFIYTTSGGYVVGCNSYEDYAKAQQFIVTPSSSYKIEGAVYWFGAKEQVGAANNVVFKVWDMDGTTGVTTAGSNQTCPGTVLTSTSISVDLIDTVNEQYVTFPAPILVTSDYAIGIDVQTTYDDTVGLITTKDGDGGGMELAWEQWNDGSWYTMLASWLLDFDICIFPIIDASSANINDNYFVFGMKMTTYPNPASTEATISYELEKDADNVVIKIVNENGKLIRKIEQGAQNKGVYSINVNLSDFSTGNYFCNLSANGKSLVKRMVIVK
ncbi:MAG TPA: T9SS type A sorting domain-containing protein [Bacteroidales bacterium]|nr:T9SS type A sorting domain-containing protein [Bacteroidales bacterium]